MDELSHRPLFALANAGIPISFDRLADAVVSPLCWGIMLGLVVGKPLGIVVTSWCVTRIGIAEAPPDAARRAVFGVGLAAGIGFTVALFITELAVDDPIEGSNATLAILVATILAAAVSTLVLRSGRPSAFERFGARKADLSVPVGLLSLGPCSPPITDKSSPRSVPSTARR